MMCPVETPRRSLGTPAGESNEHRRGGIMKKIVLAAALAVGLLGLANGRADAAGFGNGFGVSPGSFSIGLGFNVSWSGFGFGPGCGAGAGPCYGGGYTPPQMYDAY